MSLKQMRETRVQKALSNYKYFIESAREALKWARIDREKGHRDLYLDSLAQAAHWRERALKWYVKYQKALAKYEEVA